MNSARAARGVLAAGAALFVIGVIVASSNPGPRAWGLHLPGFLPQPERTLAILLLAGGAVLLAFDFLRGDAPPARVRPGPAANLPGWSGWLLLLPWSFVLWRFATRTHFLGDGTVWLWSIQLGTPSPFEPLAAAVWGAHAHLLRALGLPVDASTAALLSIACGVIAAPLLWGIATEIAPRPGSRALAFAVLVTLGLMQLYFGYIESYPPVTVAMLAFLWVGLRCLRGAAHPVLPAVLLGISIAFHLSSAFLALSFLYLLLLGSDRPWILRAGLAIVPPALAAGILVLLRYPPEQWAGAFRIAERAIEPGHGAAVLAKPYGALSLDHAWDLLNAVLLVLPVPALLLGSAVAGGVTWDRGTRFLAAAAVPGFLLAAALVLPVAPAQDWDLTSILLLPLAVLGVKMGLTIPKAPIRAARGAGLVALGAGALLSFVLVNADEEAGLSRYETLVGPGSKITAYGRAYGNELLATYDADRRDYGRAALHAQRAIEAEPTNPRYWVKKGAALYESGRYDEAMPVLLESIRRGPWRDDGYYDLGNCLVRKGRYAEAAYYYREAIRRGSPQPDYFHNLGVALYYEGKRDSARVLWLDVVRRWPSYPLSRNSLRLHFGG